MRCPENSDPDFKGTSIERAPRYLCLPDITADRNANLSHSCPLGGSDRLDIPQPQKLPSAQFSKRSESGLSCSPAKQTAYHSHAQDHSELERRLVWAD